MKAPKQIIVDEANAALRELWNLVPESQRPQAEKNMLKLSNTIHALHSALARLNQIRTVTFHADADLGHYLEQNKRVSGEGGQ